MMTNIRRRYLKVSGKLDNKCIKSNIKQAEDMRSVLNYTLKKEKHEIDVNDL